MSETLLFKKDDRVRLSLAGGRYYGAVPNRGHLKGANGSRFAFVPEGQGGGAEGTVVFAGDRPHKPGADPRPYYVLWDNGAENSYRECDLELAEDGQ